MWLKQLRQLWFGRPRGTRRSRETAPRRYAARLLLECLEDRTVLSTFTAATVADLIADIHAANANGGHNTINLTATTYDLTAADNTTDGPTGLPVIAAADKLTIEGNGATIDRSTTFGTPAFRLFDVGDDAALSLQDLTLTGASLSAPGCRPRVAAS